MTPAPVFRSLLDIGGDGGVLIFGRGGGFTLLYEALALLSDGQMRLVSYTVDYDGNPQDATSARIALGSADSYETFVRALQRINFNAMDLGAPSSTLIEYLFVDDPRVGVHEVRWNHHELSRLPAELRTVVCTIRGHVVQQFKTAFDCVAAERQDRHEDTAG